MTKGKGPVDAVGPMGSGRSLLDSKPGSKAVRDASPNCGMTSGRTRVLAPETPQTLKTILATGQLEVWED